jgi:hypothetical protein
MVPAKPRFPGVMNDLKVQQELGELNSASATSSSCARARATPSPTTMT